MMHWASIDEQLANNLRGLPEVDDPVRRVSVADDLLSFCLGSRYAILAGYMHAELIFCIVLRI